MRGDFQDLGDAYMFKEVLRNIYRQTKDSYHARMAFLRWCKLAEETGFPEFCIVVRSEFFVCCRNSHSAEHLANNSFINDRQPYQTENFERIYSKHTEKQIV